MNVDNYIEEKKKFQILLLEFLDKEEGYEENIQKLIKFLNNPIFIKDPHELQIILYTIVKIANNHHRFPNFMKKILKILDHIKSVIKEFSSQQLFDIFHNNLQILHFLINEGIMTIDESFLEKNSQYSQFFSPELNKEVNFEKNYFIEKRNKGENDNKICQLIIKDSIDDFISILNKENIDKNSTIEHSIFETNPFLIKNKQTTLIEYAAFYGSIKIFKYLISVKANLTSSLWLYSIHGKNYEILHLLEENNILPNDKSYGECLKEAVKCHHNEIANYILEKYIDKDEIKFNFDPKFDLIDLSFPNKNNQEIVELLLKQPEIEFVSNCLRSCKKLKKIKIPDHIRVIGEGSFRECISLTDVLIPNSVKSIGNHAFRECSSLTEIELPKEIISIGYYTFFKCISLRKITLPNSIKEIEDSAFDGCKSLVEISIPKSVKMIGNYVFSQCTSLRGIIFPESVIEVGFSACNECSSLEIVKFMSDITELNGSTFQGCSSLKEIILPSGFNRSLIENEYQIHIKQY